LLDFLLVETLLANANQFGVFEAMPRSEV